MTYLPATAGTTVTNAYRLLNAIDFVETPTSAEMTFGIDILNKLLRSEHQDGASKYIIQTLSYTIPAGRQSFPIGANGKSDVNVDACVLRRIDMADFGNGLVRRETRAAPKVDVRRTLQPGIVTKWNQEPQADGSILVWIWQIPRVAAACELEIGGRIPTMSNSVDLLPLPPEGVAAVELLLAKRLRGQTGRPIAAVQDIMDQAAQIEVEWKSFARGLQFVRMVR